jgi:hypothetical protein
VVALVEAAVDLHLLTDMPHPFEALHPETKIRVFSQLSLPAVDFSKNE